MVILGYSARKDLRAVYGWFAAEVHVWTFEGVVVDATTGRAIPGVAVRVVSSGWSVLPGPFSAPAYTDGVTSAAGAFRIRTRLLGDPQFFFRRSGYLFGAVRPDSATGIREVLTPLPPDSASVEERYLSTEVRSRREVFRLDLEEPRSVALGESCDVALAMQGHGRGMTISAAPGAGVRFDVGKEGGPHSDGAFVNQCVAPDSGYGPSVQLTASTPPGICFVRTRDGRHFARFNLDLHRFDPPYIRGIPDDRPLLAGLRVFLNRDGGRGLCGIEE